MDLQFVETKRGGHAIVYDGHRYGIKRTRTNSKYWTCVVKPCPGKIRTDMQNNVKCILNKHNHPPDFAKRRLEMTVARMKRKVREGGIPVQKIYENERDIWIAEGSHDKFPDFTSVRSALYREKKKASEKGGNNSGGKGGETEDEEFSEAFEMSTDSELVRDDSEVGPSETSESLTDFSEDNSFVLDGASGDLKPPPGVRKHASSGRPSFPTATMNRSQTYLNDRVHFGGSHSASRGGHGRRPVSATITSSDVTDAHHADSVERVYVNPDHSCHIMAELSSLWKSGKFVDAAIFVGGIKLQAHKMVLFAASPYLRASFDHMNPNTELRLKMPSDVKLDVIYQFLSYVYDGVLKLDTSNAHGMRKVALMLKMEYLASCCDEYITEAVKRGALMSAQTEDIVPPLLILVDQIQSDYPKSDRCTQTLGKKSTDAFSGTSTQNLVLNQDHSEFLATRNLSIENLLNVHQDSDPTCKTLSLTKRGRETNQVQPVSTSSGTDCVNVFKSQTTSTTGTGSGNAFRIHNPIEDDSGGHSENSDHHEHNSGTNSNQVMPLLLIKNECIEPEETDVRMDVSDIPHTDSDGNANLVSQRYETGTRQGIGTTPTTRPSILGDSKKHPSESHDQSQASSNAGRSRFLLGPCKSSPDHSLPE